MSASNIRRIALTRKPSGPGTLNNAVFDMLHKELSIALLSLHHVQRQEFLWNVFEIKKASLKHGLIDVIIQTIFGCEHSDDNVQLQIIKALLTCISSPQCQVFQQWRHKAPP